MHLLEKKMVEILTDLKENHHVIGVKAEFEAEGTRFEEALRLKQIVTEAGLDLTIKIGGCEALKDIFDAKNIGVKAIVAPMIESPYAALKYLKAVKTAFTAEELTEMQFLINIETKYGLQYLEDILNSDFAKDLNGIVLGRTDLTGSLGMKSEDVNHPIILEIAKDVALKTKQYKKDLVIGGGVSATSLPFLKSMPEDSLTRFETRKIIFDAQQALKDNDVEKGILKAISFEILWIKNKKNLYNAISAEDTKRIEVLESRYKNSLNELREYTLL